MVVRYNYLLGDLFGLARFLARGEGAKKAHFSASRLRKIRPGNKRVNIFLIFQIDG